MTKYYLNNNYANLLTKYPRDRVFLNEWISVVFELSSNNMDIIRLCLIKQHGPWIKLIFLTLKVLAHSTDPQ